MNKQIFTNKEITILTYILNQKKKEYKNSLNNTLKNDLLNKYIKRTIFELDIIIKKIKNLNFISNVEVF